MKSRYARLAIKIAEKGKQIREKTLLTFEEFLPVSLYLLLLTFIAGAFAGSLLFVILTR